MLSKRIISAISRLSTSSAISGAVKSAASTGKFTTSATTNMDKNDIAKAIDLLTNYSATVTPSERSKYIDQFTSVLNSELNKTKSDPLATSSSHFEQSLDGLSNLINNVTNVNTLDAVSLRQKIDSVSSEQELLNIFDSLIHSGNLSLSSFKFIIMNKNCFSLKHFLNKFEFLDPHNKEFVNHKILVVIKASILKDNQLALDLYNKNIDTWVSNFEKNRLGNSVVLIKSLFQVIYKVKRDLKLLQKMHNFNNDSLILLTEALPRQIGLYLHSILDANPHIELSNNQSNYTELLSILTSHNLSNPQVSNLVKKLIKSSITNKLHTELKANDEQLTLLQYRFHNELISIIDEASELIQDSHLEKLSNDLKEKEKEETYPLLKFI